MDDAHSIGIELLLAHGDFVRGLARSLLGRDDRVDDVVQDTWVVALAKRPDRAGAARAWLGGVVRNLVGTLRRRDLVRAAELLAEDDGAAVVSAREVAEREATRATLIRAVLALPEPFRAAVLLRYYEELPPREIAARIGVPVETVRSRLRRGIERLRARLAPEEGRARALAIGSALMSTKAKVTVAVLALALFGGTMALWPTPAPEFGPAAPAVPEEPGGPAPEGAPRTAEEPPLEAGIVATEKGRAVADATTETDRRVVDQATGEPVEGARVTLYPVRPGAPVTAVTGRDGKYGFGEVEPGIYSLSVVHPDYAPAGLVGVRVDSEKHVGNFRFGLVRDAERVGSLEGTVIDETGAPMPGAKLVIHDLSGVRLDTAANESGGYRVERLLPGWYAVSLAPAAEGEHLWTRTQNVEIRARETARLDVRRYGTVTGVVLDADGEPLADAAVILSRVTVADGSLRPRERRGTTDGKGRFSIEDGGIGEHRLWVMSKGGGNSAEAAVVNLTGNDQEVEVRLPASGLTLRPVTKRPRDGELIQASLRAVAEGRGGAAVSPAAHAYLGTDGLLHLRWIPPGRYRLVVHGIRSTTAERRVLAEREVVVTRGVVSELEIPLD